MARRFFKIVLGTLLAAFSGAQFIGPKIPAAGRGLNARSIWQDRSVPPEVDAILRRSCADCHSSETRWPWYAHIAPVSWTIARDMRRARGHLNLSDWPPQPDVEKAEIGDMVVNRMMPPKRYLMMHPDARLSDAERRTVVDWIQNAPK